ncbi:carbohydrate ABC transporter permease [Mesorhizobium sp. YR577]|jgi:multiple sugar transport system permease protein|uniref:carbohydrate ABC transporter permease n=1 Tax=Mesorhizobium sp. YR577 TaxID=1884373 RepID=UPI0008E2AACE|nr:carbohydrate ABC transporter permease [Mesorhizobium sp. YR577]SFT58153.1 carbohydrate ABC transporter membrane protein 2, CUT1 family [Mesorhizobium sp. YR577]
MKSGLSAVAPAFKTGFRRAILGLFVVWTLFPLYWLVNTSLKQPVDVVARPPSFVFVPTLENYASVIADPVIIGYFLTTFSVSAATTLFAVVIGTPAAYVLARFDFRGSTDIGFWILSTRFTPPVAMLIPFFVIFQAVGLLNTHVGLVIAHVALNLSLVIWLMRGFFAEIPKELEEAAYIDGAGYLRTFFTIILPLSRTGIAAVAVLVFLFTWNEFLFSLILGGQIPMISVGLYKFIGYQQIEWGRLSATASLMLIPVLLILLMFQRQLVQGLTLGAVK